ncbi:MAG: M48 family metallopeptidase [Candidatus Omnitrophica bacterium]|jgi:STE24 endopeptidase|nr:M48 family metallopeptidase [Candidatus Omnitrophota bacterium]
MNIYLLIILSIIAIEYLLNLIVERLNVKHASGDLPCEFEGFYDAQKYKLAQFYLKENTNFHLIKDTISVIITLIFILAGGFNFIDNIARSFNQGPIVTGLIFTGILGIVLQLLSIPFSAYHTFVIEAKYGFNKTTLKTFISDIIKGLILTIIIGAIVLSIIFWFFYAAGSFAWIYCWIAVTLFQLFLLFIAPVVIMPLFNKYTPLEDGELKSAIENYAKEQKFALAGVFKMDASKRSTKSNAFFTGFGKFRRIALFDTLIQKHTTDELVSVLAHEIGHYKKKHFIKGIILSVITTGIMFFILSFFINNKGLFDAFKMQNLSIYASLIFFGFLYSPINLFISIFSNIISRKHEYEADDFAVKTYNKPESFITALKKLTVDNLSNLTPHPLKVFLDYSHPPVLKRIEAIRERV